MNSTADPPAREKTLRRGGAKSYVEEMEARIAVLEQIAQDTKTILVDMKQDIRDIRLDQKTDFRLLFGALITTTIGLACLMARGFHWL